MHISSLVNSIPVADLRGGYAVTREHRNEISLVSAYSNHNVDSFSISDIARRLSASLQRSKTSLLDKSGKIDIADSLSGIGKDVYRQMGKAVNILERIGELSKLAEDDSLSDDARVELQIEIANLQDNLEVIPFNILGLDGGRREFGTATQTGIEFYKANGVAPGNITGDFGDGSSMLERMRTRIMNGEEWDVKEAWAPEGCDIVSVDENGAVNVSKIPSAGWYVIDDSIKGSESVPTVSQRLEAATSYVVMDAKSAHETSALVNERIEKIQEWGEKLPEIMQNSSDIVREANLFLDGILFPDGVKKLPVIGSDIASYFLFGDEVHSSRYPSLKLSDDIRMV